MSWAFWARATTASFVRAIPTCLTSAMLTTRYTDPVSSWASDIALSVFVATIAISGMFGIRAIARGVVERRARVPATARIRGEGTELFFATWRAWFRDPFGFKRRRRVAEAESRAREEAVWGRYRMLMEQAEGIVDPIARREIKMSISRDFAQSRR